MVIILNGAGSSGKSTIAQKLTTHIIEPTVYHNFDLLIPTLLPHKDSFKPPTDPDSRTYVRRLDDGLYGKMRESGLSLLPLVYEFIKPLHRGGFNVVVDTLLPGECIIPLFTMLSGIETYVIGIRCSLDELRQRELQRKDRKVGNAEKTFHTVHMNKIYDLEVDTSKLDADGCAKQIVDYVSKASPVAFGKMQKLYEKNKPI